MQINLFSGIELLTRLREVFSITSFASSVTCEPNVFSLKMPIPENNSIRKVYKNEKLNNNGGKNGNIR